MFDTSETRDLPCYVCGNNSRYTYSLRYMDNPLWEGLVFGLCQDGWFFVWGFSPREVGFVRLP